MNFFVVTIPPLPRSVLAGHVVSQACFDHEHEFSHGPLLGQHLCQGALAVVHGVAPALHEKQQPQLPRGDLVQHLPDR